MPGDAKSGPTYEHLRVALVTGSRRWSDVAVVDGMLERFAPNLLIHGACPTGTDEIADQWARKKGVPVVRMAARWKRLGAPAGPERNKNMVTIASLMELHGAIVRVLAFPLPEGKGTQNCMRLARKARLMVLEPKAV